jgi:site-specific recombinase XerD
MKSTVLASKAPGTTDSFRRAFSRWKHFASSRNYIQAFPASPRHVALYLQFLLDTTGSANAVDSALYAINWAHNLAGLPSPTSHPVITMFRDAAKRLQGSPIVNKKRPISADMIKQLFKNSNLESLLQLRNVCMFVLAYSIFFRIEEVLNLRRKYLQIYSDYLSVSVEKSKTDQLRKGHEVLISASPNCISCPVKILKLYLHLSNSD